MYDEGKLLLEQMKMNWCPTTLQNKTANIEARDEIKREIMQQISKYVVTVQCQTCWESKRIHFKILVTQILFYFYFSKNVISKIGKS